MKKSEQSIQDSIKDSLIQYLRLHNAAYSERFDLHSCSSDNTRLSSMLSCVSAWGEINCTYPFSYCFKRQNTYCIIKTLNGIGSIRIGDEKYTMAPSSVFFFSCDKLMNIKIQSSQWSYIVLYL